MADRFARVTGNWADTSTWSATAGGSVGASVPSSGDSAIINVANKDGGAGALTITLTGDVEVDGLELYGTSGNDATLHTASEHTVTINSYGIGGYSAKIHGYTEVTGNVNLTFTRAGAHTIIIDAGTQTNKVNDITVNHASNVLLCGSAVNIKGDLTVTAGTYTTNSAADGSGTDYALTVTGDVSVTGTLTGNESAISMKSLTIAAAGTYSATNQTTTITGESSGGYALYNEGDGTFTHNNGLVLITTNTNTFIAGMEGDDTSGTGANALNRLQVELGDAAYYCKLRPYAGTAHVIKGDVTVAEGIFRTETDAHTLTIEGDVSVESGGTLGHADHDAADSFGSLTIASGGTCIASEGVTSITGIVTGAGPTAYSQSGTFTHNGGTMKFNYAGNQKILATTSFDNLIIDGDGGTKEFQALTIAGDLEVTASDTFKSDNGTEALTVGGGVDVSGILGSGETGAFEFGGIRINSGGTYNATSGTTTVTNRFTGTSNLWKNDGGTFNHNNGTVKFTDNDHSLIKELTFYNLEAASSLGDYALSWETSSGTACTILGDLTITRGDFEIHAAGNTLDVYGQTIINGASNSGARFNNDKNQTGTITHHGLVTIIQGTYHVEDGGTVNMAGIRNVGGLVD
tara:strand:+ start:45 stop:1940 length:1896 start_codon:yes stop_codon:yes gene_type:complete